jgi:hypothetical protein
VRVSFKQSSRHHANVTQKSLWSELEYVPQEFTEVYFKDSGIPYGEMNVLTSEWVETNMLLQDRVAKQFTKASLAFTSSVSV